MPSRVDFASINKKKYFLGEPSLSVLNKKFSDLCLIKDENPHDGSKLGEVFVDELIGDFDGDSIIDTN